MKDKQKLKYLEEWLAAHGAKVVGDLVYDKMGMVTYIDKGLFDYEIRISPLRSDHNLGAGYGGMLIIIF